MASGQAKKLVRSVLVRFPRLYDTLTSQWRYRAYHRLHLVHEPEFKAIPQLVQRPDPLVLDVGGNNGQSILSIKAVLPRARVISFEPASRHQDDLRALAAKLSDVRVEQFALAAADGEAELFWPVYNGLPMHGLASLDRAEAAQWLGPDTFFGFDPKQQVIESERVTLLRLDELHLDPDVIKIDVQGTEADVIRGGLETIQRARPAIIAEALEENDDALELLRPMGYDIYSLKDGKIERGADPAATNQFLLPEERVQQPTPAARED
jgi:FkbM family methyltransferase